jgi:hypothetical protein
MEEENSFADDQNSEIENSLSDINLENLDTIKVIFYNS